MVDLCDFSHLDLYVPVSIDSVCMGTCAPQAQSMSVYTHNGCTRPMAWTAKDWHPASSCPHRAFRQRNLCLFISTLPGRFPSLPSQHFLMLNTSPPPPQSSINSLSYFEIHTLWLFYTAVLVLYIRRQWDELVEHRVCLINKQIFTSTNIALRCPALSLLRSYLTIPILHLTRSSNLPTYYWWGLLFRQVLCIPTSCEARNNTQ